MLHYLKRLQKIERELYKMMKRKELYNNKFSILSSNCVGTFIYCDLGLPYLSPTINLSIGMDDFVKLVGNPKWYMEQKLIQGNSEAEEYPVGLLGDIKINFIHYHTFEEAVEKWEKRKKRIEWDNLFIIGTERDGCTYDTLRRFEELPYKNKVIFTHVKYPEFSSAYYIKGFEKKGELGTITNFKEQFWRRRYMEDFDYVAFLNEDKDYDKNW